MIEIIFIGIFLIIIGGIQVFLYASLSAPKSAKDNSSSSLIAARINAMKENHKNQSKNE